MNLDLALKAFLEEADELLEQMESLLLGTSQAALSGDDLNALFRVMHTLKGSAGIFGFDYLVGFAHEAESVLDRVREGSQPLDASLVALLLACHDHVKACIADWVSGQAIDEEEGRPLRQRLLFLLETPESAPVVKSAAEPVRRWRIKVGFGPDILRDGMELTDIFAYLGSLVSIESIVADLSDLPDRDSFDPCRCYLGFDLLVSGEVDEPTLSGAFGFVQDCSSVRISPVTDSDAPPQDEPAGDDGGDDLAALPLPIAAKVAQGHRMVKVEASRIDQMIDLVGELVIASSAASLLAQRHHDAELGETASQIAVLVEAIRSRVLGMRMVEIGDIFGRFPRLVRDLSVETGKPVRLVVHGSETELDKSMVDRLGEPLTHLLRNAIDHGIEAAEVRAAAGKPLEGTITLSARHEAGSIVIELTDDGGGMDVGKILARARERGLIGATEIVSDNEILALIFLPGFSTATQVTALSGRGVGMDAVRQAIDDLRGTIDMTTRPGAGSSFRLRLPLTLAIIDGFLVRVAGNAFVVPLDRVVECLEIRASDVPEEAFGYIELRGRVLPLVVLSAFLGLERRAVRRRNVVVVRFGERQAGLVVDDLEGECQIVVKPLGGLFRHLKALSGSTILGNGAVALILDVSALIDAATHDAARRAGGSAIRGAASPLQEQGGG